MEQIEMDVAAGEAAVLSQRADELEQQTILEQAQTESDRLRAQAELIRIQSRRKNFELNFDGAKRELQEIKELLEQLKPQCKFWNEDILQMEADMQRDEWAEEFKSRAENMLIANSIGIGYDHIAAMRQHPDFYEKILPHIKQVGNKLLIAQKTQDFTQVESVLTKELPFLPPEE